MPGTNSRRELGRRGLGELGVERTKLYLLQGRLRRIKCKRDLGLVKGRSLDRIRKPEQGTLPGTYEGELS